MFHFPPFKSNADLSAGRDLREWRTRVLDGILRGILSIWIFALVSGINNVIEAYRAETDIHENPLLIAGSIVGLYLVFTALLLFTTFNRNLKYELRAGLLLLVLYAIGTTGLALSSLSGDGRIFFFAIVVLTAILFDRKGALVSFFGVLATFIIIGWLQVTGVIVVPPERQVNSIDLGAWISGGIVFIVLNVAALISITYLLRAFGRSLAESQDRLQREQRLGRILRTVSDINQLIVREQDQRNLLVEACQLLISGRGYSFAWVGLLEPDNITLKFAAFAGDPVDAKKFNIRLDQENHGLPCVEAAIRTQKFARIQPSGENDPCSACPRRVVYPGRLAVSLPLLREDRVFGVLVVDHSLPLAVFDDQEVQLLQELANDLAYALEKIKADAQHRLLVETTSALLSARDTDTLWSAAMTAVKQVLRADRTAVYLYDRAADRLSCAYASGLSDEYITELNLRFHQVPGSQLISNPQPVTVSDTQTDPSVASMRDWMMREGFRSYAVFPLLMSQGTFGAVVAYRNPVAPFSDDDLTAGQTLSHMLGLAMENIRLYTETRTKATELGKLYAAAQDMAASLMDPPALLHSLARHMTEALNVTSGNIVSVNRAESKLTVLAEYWTENANTAERHSNLGDVFNADNYPTIMSAMYAGRIIVIQSDDAGLSPAERQQFADYDIKSMLFVPIIAHGRLLGDAEIWESRERREFSQADIRLAQAMAGHAASIIENSDLVNALRASETRYRMLVEQASDGIFLADPQRRYVDVNPSGCAMLGYSREEILTMQMDDLAVKEEVAAIPWRLDELRQGKYLIVERQLRRKDGSIIPVEISARMLPNGYLQGIVRDITERKQAEKALAQREAYFRALIENSAEGVAILDAEGNIRYIAPAEERLTGYTPEEAIGHSAFRFIHPQDVVDLQAVFVNAIQKPGSVLTLEYRLQRKDGVWRNFEVTGHNMLNDPHVAGVVINYRDITERKQAEEGLHRRAHELEILAEVSSSLRIAQSVEEMIPVMLEQAVQSVDGVFGSLFLLEPETGYLISRGWYAVDAGVGKWQSEESRLRHPPGEGVTGHVADTGQIYITKNMNTDPVLVIHAGEQSRLKNVQSGISLPLHAKEHVVGVLHIGLEEPHTFSDTEISLLTAVSEVAGNAIHRAMLYEQTLRQADELALAYDNTLAGWARALELRDELTEGHTRRVTELTVQLARAMGVPEHEISFIRRGALLHDIGKMGIPDSILHKPGPLTAREKQIMQLHPQYAHDMLSFIPFLRPALDIPYCHHEKWDGTGYPRGLKGDEIPLAARIFSVADVWDALASDRPYRSAWDLAKVREYIQQESGRYFDTRIVEKFLQMDLEGWLTN